MKTLVWVAKHDNKRRSRTRRSHTVTERSQGPRRARPPAGCRPRTAKRRLRRPLPRSPASPRCMLADNAAYEHRAGRERSPPLIVDLMGHLTTRSWRPPPPPARTSMPRVAALLDVDAGLRGHRRSSQPDTFVRPIYAGNAMADRAVSGRQDQDRSPSAATNFKAAGRRLRSAPRSRQIAAARAPRQPFVFQVGAELSKSRAP